MKLNISKPIVFSTLIIALLSLFMVSGCQPDDTLPDTCTNNIKDGNETAIDCGGSCSPCAAASNRIKKRINTYLGIPSEIYYTYDSQGRIESFATNSGTTINYVYYGNDSIKEIYNNGYVIYTLNSNGYASSKIAPDGTVTNYTYDSEGHLLSNNHGIVNTWDAAGNMLTTTEMFGHSYTYFTDRANTIGNENEGRKFLGKSSTNLVRTRTSSQGGNTINYAYQYDSLNRVTSQQGVDWVETFTYY